MTQIYYLIKPEVAGQLGDNTVLNYSTNPPTILTLHYQFDGWLGDDILEGFQCFICSETLANHLKKIDLTGFKFEQCEISKSNFFLEAYAEIVLPKFYWFKVDGKLGDDFFLTYNNSLVVSDKALNVLKRFNISHCDIENFR